ncbi:MAG: hypothetical protein HC848_10645 [Limnobacter sp.]|nr:hypothetical protein [Limnobacter sp.]
MQKDSAIEAARAKLDGAQAKFITSAVAGVITIGMGLGGPLHWRYSSEGKGARKIAAENKELKAKGLPQRQVPPPNPSHWTGPSGILLITQPVNAIGEYVQAHHQYDAEKIEAELNRAREVSRQVADQISGADQMQGSMARNG